MFYLLLQLKTSSTPASRWPAHSAAATPHSSDSHPRCTLMQVQLPQLNAPAAYVSPYGVAMQQAAAGSELEHRLVAGLVG